MALGNCLNNSNHTECTQHLSPDDQKLDSSKPYNNVHYQLPRTTSKGQVFLFCRVKIFKAGTNIDYDILLAKCMAFQLSPMYLTVRVLCYM